ncbi:MAG TPA: DUF1275 family protein [Phycisphaerales bacterium]|nr:DUF1275 family protein [Phycisphaerales bacterium]
MFVVQAHSFQQQSRLAITLAWVAGYTNIVALLTCGHVTSHVSGTTSDFGRFLAEARWGPAGFVLFLLVAFLLGAFLSGVLTEIGRRRGWESIYVAPMAAEALLLAGFAVGVEFHEEPASQLPVWTTYLLTGLASAAMGVQNATITRISSGVVRTTHVTGVLTDLGLEAAQFLSGLHHRLRNGTAAPRGGPHSAMRLALLASIMVSFALGACLGTLAHDWQPRYAMFPPVLFLLWVVYQDLAHPIAEIEPSTLVSEELGLDDRIAVFQLVREAKHRNHTHVRAPIHRMPNLLAWSERLPPTARVIILDLGGVTHIDHNSAMELRAVMQQLMRSGKRLILAGLSPDQVRQLQEAGLGELLRPENTCPDVELAVAQGLNGLG